MYLEPTKEKMPAELVNFIGKRLITIIHLAPSMLSVFVNSISTTVEDSPKAVICSGEALLDKTASLCFNRLVGGTVHNLYGPTEASIDVSYKKFYSNGFHSATVAIGRSILNTC